jgi:hypothetical protein
MQWARYTVSDWVVSASASEAVAADKKVGDVTKTQTRMRENYDESSAFAGLDYWPTAAAAASGMSVRRRP